MKNESIESAITALGPWFHNIDLGNGIRTKSKTVGSEPADHPRAKWELLKRFIPENLTGKTVLDIGCNAGFYSIEAKRRGAARVLGIDAGSREIRQARFVRDVLGLDIDFQRMSVYDISPRNIGTFDVTLALGLLYHCKHLIMAIERLFVVSRGLVVIESEVLPDSASASIQANLGGLSSHLHPMTYVENDSTAQEAPHNWFVPSVSALIAMLKDVGFEQTTLVDRTGARAVLTAWNTAAPTSARHPALLGGRLELLDAAPVSSLPGQTISLQIRSENTGFSTWLKGEHSSRGAVHLAARLRPFSEHAFLDAGIRAAFSSDVLPGEREDVVLKVPMPQEPGIYELEIDLLAESITWFQDCGSWPLNFIISVEDASAQHSAGER